MRHRFRTPSRDPRPEAGLSGAPMTIQVTCGGMLCELRYWSEAEWAALSEAAPRPRRPTPPASAGSGPSRSSASTDRPTPLPYRP